MFSPKNQNEIKKTPNLMIKMILVVFVLNTVYVPGFSLAQEELPAETTTPVTEETQLADENTAGVEGENGISTGETLIDTGDAQVNMETENDINQNSFSDTPETEEPVASEENTVVEEQSATGNAGETEEPEADGDGSASKTTVGNENISELENDLEGGGITGDNIIEGSDATSTISTGDAGVNSLTDNNINGNDTDVQCENGCDATSTDETEHVIDVSNDNTASTTNDIGLGGNTGDNTIEESGDSVIDTGDVGIINIVINYINNNFFGEGKEFFVDIFNHVMDTIDLSGYYDDSQAESGGECEILNCEVTVNNDNEAVLNNAVVIDANTGANLIASSSGESYIETGDIDIVSDVLNIANLNVTGEGWFFAVVNIFGTLEGDVILPGIDEGTDEGTLVVDPESIESSSRLIVTNSNMADVLNNININASTGDNTIASSGEAVILTGDVNVESNTFNLINYNLTGNSWKFAKVNVFGDWEGFIHGLPEGYGYYDDGTTITIYSDFLNDPAFYAAYAQMVVDNKNLATTTNDVEINANTGGNNILHGGGGATIQTGDINVQSNVVNFINNNFTGNDWEFSMVNVFGEWQGNLAFGQPDLWVTESSSTEGPVGKNEYITYNFLFGNSGDGNASGVQLFDDFNEELLSVAGEESAVGMLWNIENLPPNTQGSLSYTVQVNNDIPYGQSSAENTATIFSRENDRNFLNNTVSGSVMLDGGSAPASGSSSGGGGISDVLSYGNSRLPSFAIVKTNDADGIVRPGDIVNFQVVIKNTGSAVAEDTLVFDVMSNFDSKKVVSNQLWNLGVVYDGEEIIIDYALEIKNNIETGTYINEVVVEGFDTYRNMYITGIATSKIRVENNNYVDIPLLLEVNNISDTGLVNPGDLVKQKLLITNNSLVTAFGVKITEALPKGLTYAEEDGKISKTWELGDIKPGISKTIDYDLLVSEDVRAGDYLKILELTASNLETKVIEDHISVETVQVLSAEVSFERPVRPEPVLPVSTIDSKPESIFSMSGSGDMYGPYPGIVIPEGIKLASAPELDQTFNTEPFKGVVSGESAVQSGASKSRINLLPARYGLLAVLMILALLSLLVSIVSIRKILHHDHDA